MSFWSLERRRSVKVTYFSWYVRRKLYVPIVELVIAFFFRFLLLLFWYWHLIMFCIHIYPCGKESVGNTRVISSLIGFSCALWFSVFTGSILSILVITLYLWLVLSLFWCLVEFNMVKADLQEKENSDASHLRSSCCLVAFLLIFKL